MSADTYCCPEPVGTATAAAAPAKQNNLWKRYRKSGPGSLSENELIEQYLPLVKTVVGRVAVSLPSHVDAEDLHSAGLVGLLNAVRRYKPDSGVAFETYARVRIRGSVLDELRRLDWVPRSIHSKARKVEETMRHLEQEIGHVPSDQEMAEAMGLPMKDYLHLLETIRPATFVCLDSVRNPDSDEGATQYESVADHSQPDPSHHTARRELAAMIASRLESMPEMQRKVLSLYYFEDLRLREIAEAFGVTESRICQIHAQAILSIKSYLRKQEALPQ